MSDLLKKPIRVAVVGANAGYGWGGAAHMRALSSLPMFQVSAVCNSREGSARENAAHFNVPKAYWNIAELAEDPEIDFVSICVNVGSHRELSLPLLEAGKSVLCEWPLAVTTSDAEGVAAIAERRGAKGFVGLQARLSPAVAEARRIILSGELGPLAFVRLDQSLPFQTTPKARTAYLQSASSGADFLSVPVAHALDVLCHCVGPIDRISSVMATIVKQVRVTDTHEMIERTSPDHLAFCASASGAVVSATFRGGPLARGGFEMVITGCDGEIRLWGEEGGRVQMTPLQLERRSGNGDFHPIPIASQEGERNRELGPAANVARLYEAIGIALTGGAANPPTFEDALDLHRFVDLVRAGDRT